MTPTLFESLVAEKIHFLPFQSQNSTLLDLSLILPPLSLGTSTTIVEQNTLSISGCRHRSICPKLPSMRVSLRCTFCKASCSVPLFSNLYRPQEYPQNILSGFSPAYVCKECFLSIHLRWCHSFREPIWGSLEVARSYVWMQKCPRWVFFRKSSRSNGTRGLSHRSGQAMFRIFGRCSALCWSQRCRCLWVYWKTQTPVWPTLQWNCWFLVCQNHPRETCHSPDEAWMCARRLAGLLRKTQIQIPAPFQRLGECRSILGSGSRC